MKLVSPGDTRRRCLRCSYLCKATRRVYSKANQAHADATVMEPPRSLKCQSTCKAQQSWLAGATYRRPSGTQDICLNHSMQNSQKYTHIYDSQTLHGAKQACIRTMQCLTLQWLLAYCVSMRHTSASPLRLDVLHAMFIPDRS